MLKIVIVFFEVINNEKQFSFFWEIFSFKNIR